MDSLSPNWGILTQRFHENKYITNVDTGDNSEIRYYVVVDGQKLGPFDKRTITGMRVKKILGNDNLVFDELGRETTVFSLVGAQLSGTFGASVGLQTTGSLYPRFPVTFVKPSMRPYAGMSFRGDGELRIQPDVLRVSGVVRDALWKASREDRVKIPHQHLQQISRDGARVTLYAPKVVAQDVHGEVSVFFRTEEEAIDFVGQLRHIQPRAH
jgi:hypothetical protein